MAIVKPFKAVRPSRDKAALVSSKSYEAYTPAELGAKLNFNPFSFLHILNPDYKYHQEVSSEQRFPLVHKKYNEFKSNAYFTKDDKPAFYIYQNNTPTKSYCGIISATAAEDYHNNVIKKHEDTLQKREVLFEKYLKKTGFNAEPVLLTYPDNDVIENIIKKHQLERPEYEFATTDKNTHFLWVINDDEEINLISKAFKNVATLYIADGHHRTTSSCLLAKKLATDNKNHTGNEPYNYFMSYLLPESQVDIYEFNRFIRDLNGLTSTQFLEELGKVFQIKKKHQEIFKPSEKNQFSMYLDGEFYALSLKDSTYKITDELSKLDAQILFTTVLKPILGINDIRNDSKIVYSQNKSGSLELKTKVDTGEFKVSFGMLPATIEELKNIVDADLLMPPKTTFIEPKLRSALTIYEL
jgi:uncharacterized protein (DUF1015 family)